MYPIVRFLKEMAAARNLPPLAPGEPHVSHHRCWPWDLDPWRELNNGRTLTLYDLGRIPLALRTGIVGALRRNRWGMTVAGASVRYRRRVTLFERFEMRSRVVCWDARFFYLDQSIWRPDGDCANQALYRMAVTGPGGIVPTAEVLSAAGADPASPPVPEWIARWTEAEAARPWPPLSTEPPQRDAAE